MVYSSVSQTAAGVRPAVLAPTVPEVLVDQHHQLRELIAGVRETAGAERIRSFERLRRLLAAHETAEEVVVRPVSRQIVNRDALAARNREERRIMRLLAVLEKLDTGGSEFEEIFQAFAIDLENHMSLEERVEFPVLATELGGPDRVTLARWVARAITLGPTRAHPGVFGLPRIERAVAPFYALRDHMRDAHARAREELAEHSSD